MFIGWIILTVWLKIPLGHRLWKRLLIRTLPLAMDETVARKWMNCLRMEQAWACRRVSSQGFLQSVTAAGTRSFSPYENLF